MFFFALLFFTVVAEPAHVSTKNSIRRRRDETNTDPLNFASPNGMCNVTLMIGGKKIIVSKEFLAIHSSVLSELFTDKENQEVEIKDVDYDEFVSLLQVIFPGRPNPITDTTVLAILALGSRFQIERVLDLTEKHLMASNQLSIPAKLQMADQHGLIKLRASNLQAYTSLSKLGSLRTTPEYETFSDSMKAALCDRMMDMIKMILLILLLSTAACAHVWTDWNNHVWTDWNNPNIDPLHLDVSLTRTRDDINKELQSSASGMEGITVANVPSYQPDVRFASASGMCKDTAVVAGPKELVVAKEIHCLQNFTSVSGLPTLQATAECSTFSDSIKAVICDRFMELSKDFKYCN